MMFYRTIHRWCENNKVWPGKQRVFSTKTASVLLFCGLVPNGNGAPVNLFLMFSHVANCITSCSQSGKTTPALLKTLYKQTLQVLDKRPASHHHCNISQKHKLDTFFSFLCVSCSCQFIVWGNSLSGCFSVKGVHITAARQWQHNCTFGRWAFSIRATNYWNSVRNEIRDISTFIGFIHSFIYLLYLLIPG